MIQNSEQNTTFQSLSETVKSLSLYELHRLMVLAWIEFEDPKRLSAVKNRIKVGECVEWFNIDTNKTHKAIVLEKKRKYVTLCNEDDGCVCTVPFHVLNVSNSSAELIPDSNQKLTRQNCSVGDFVGFSHEGQNHYGRIVRLNPKTATIYTKCNQKWRVGYSHLVKVVDAECE